MVSFNGFNSRVCSDSHYVRCESALIDWCLLMLCCTSFSTWYYYLSTVFEPACIPFTYVLRVIFFHHSSSHSSGSNPHFFCFQDYLSTINHVQQLARTSSFFLRTHASLQIVLASCQWHLNACQSLQWGIYGEKHFLNFKCKAAEVLEDSFYSCWDVNLMFFFSESCAICWPSPY